MHGAVAADVEQCSTVGVGILQLGGSAVDSAVASMACLGVINMFSSGIGGGGFMVVFAGSQTEVIDFRETAPAAAHRDMYKDLKNGSIYGGLGIGVPGELRGMELAHKRHGRLPWARILQPAIDLALGGFKVTRKLASILKENSDVIMSNEVMRDVYAPGGSLAKEGDLLKRPRLGKTLKLIALNGVDEFYLGSLAKDVVEEITSQGGIITLEDLENYRAVIRHPVSTKYQGYTLLSAPSPASGAVLLEIMNILEGYNFEPKDRSSVLTYHRIIEAFKFAYAKRTQLGDPEFADVKDLTEAMLSKDGAKKVRSRISDERTFSADYYGPHYDVEETPGTSHLSVLAPDNTAVAVTSTINLILGSRVMGNGTGIVYNDQMDDFSLPNVTNYFGVEPSEANFIEAGKRPLSSCSPTVVAKEGRVKMVVGASGGTRITTSTALVLLHALSFNRTIDEAVRMPRIHHQLLPNTVYMEEEVSNSLITGLTALGHNMTTPMPRANVQGILFDVNHHLNASSDFRKGGVAKIY